MIVELFSDLVDERAVTNNGEAGIIAHLSPIFYKLGLPAPTADEVHYTREGGVLLPLIEYGAVIRIFNHVKTTGRMPANNYHLYHPDVLPSIGCVRFPKFSMLIMPAAKLYGCEDIGHTLSDKFNEEIGHHGDASVMQNLGYAPPYSKTEPSEVCLIDTVVETRAPEKYFAYLSDYADKIITHYNQFSDLQHAFYKAWVAADDTQDSMKEFWQLCKQTKEEGVRTQLGWLEKENEVLQSANRQKKGFVERSEHYYHRTQSL